MKTILVLALVFSGCGAVQRMSNNNSESRDPDAVLREGMRTYSECVFRSTGHYYKASESPTDAVEAATANCAAEYDAYEKSAVYFYTQTSNVLDARVARIEALKAAPEFKDKVKSQAIKRVLDRRMEATPRQ